MYIKSIYISNFKCIQEACIELNESFNVLIGQNNVGKTTIIEALLLWKKCYDRNVTTKLKTFYANSRNLSFDDLANLRITDDVDLFYKVSKNKKADSSISIEFFDDGELYNLGFCISKAGHIDNAYYQVSYNDADQFVLFSDLAKKYGTNLKNLITFTDTRPISNIVSAEPYMYKPQIRKKINKGKGFEVLRNKIVNNSVDIKKIEEYLSTILEKNVRFNEKDRDNKEYIKLYVNIDGHESDILSQGSGFLQIADIFTSFEFFNSELYVLLIDEPDSHLHLSQQKKLLSEFRRIQKSQALVISHNERFIENALDSEIIFINEIDKNKGILKPLTKGAKKFVIENLVGEFKDIDRLVNAEKILMVEGELDKCRIIKLMEYYSEFKGENDGDVYIFPIDGIDKLTDKMPSIISAHSNLVDKNIEWILLKDTDCIPVNKLNKYSDYLKNYIYHDKKKVIFQKGYEFESTLFSDSNFLQKLLQTYYEPASISIEEINEINDEFFTNCLMSLSNNHLRLKSNFDRQKRDRTEKIYKNLTFEEYLKSLNKGKIEYCLCKQNINDYLNIVHEKINSKRKSKRTNLTSQTIFDFYLDSYIKDINDIHISHIEILEYLFK